MHIEHDVKICATIQVNILNITIKRYDKIVDCSGLICLISISDDAIEIVITVQCPTCKRLEILYMKILLLYYTTVHAKVITGNLHLMYIFTSS